MFLYLFLVAALIASSETPTTMEDAELQEIITLLTAEDSSASAISTVADITIETPIETAQPTSIIITNAIKPDMLAYKHWTGTYKPDTFTIQVNGVEVTQGTDHILPTTKDPVEIRYDYSFMNGMRSGAKTVSYQLNENITHANITFSWKEDWKVLIDNGKALTQKDISQ